MSGFVGKIARHDYGSGEPPAESGGMKLASLLLLSTAFAATVRLAPEVSADTKGARPKATTPPSASVEPDGLPPIGTSFCSSTANSTGAVADLTIFGSAVALDDDVTLVVSGLPAESFGVFLTSRFPGFLALPAGSSGNVCVRRDVGRFVGPGQVRSSGVTQSLSLDSSLGEWSTQAIPRTGGTYMAMAGTRTHFQLWFRDNVGGVPTSNFSDAEYVDWQ